MARDEKSCLNPGHMSEPMMQHGMGWEGATPAQRASPAFESQEQDC